MQFFEELKRRNVIRVAPEYGGISMEEFLYRSTGLTAETFGLDDRGRIEKGCAADIIAFDPDEFAPVATFAAWNELSVGVIYSMINGQLNISGGQYTGILPGLVLLGGK